MIPFGPYGGIPNAQPEQFSDNSLKLVPQAIRGTRSFAITKDGFLTGIFYQQVWTPGWNYAHNWRGIWPKCTTSIRTANGFVYVDTWECVAPVTRVDSLMRVEAPIDTVHTQTLFHRAVENVRIHDRTARWGFYAYNEGSNDFGPCSDGVSATIEGAGLMVVGSRGFRAPKARIIGLTFGNHVDLITVSKVLDNYPDVPIFATFEAMVAALPPDHWKENDAT